MAKACSMILMQSGHYQNQYIKKRHPNKDIDGNLNLRGAPAKNRKYHYLIKSLYFIIKEFVCEPKHVLSSWAHVW